MQNKKVNEIRSFLVALPRPLKSFIATTTDFVGFVTCTSFAYWVVSPVAVPLPRLAAIVVLFSAFSIAVVWLLGLYRSVVRYVGLDLLIAALKISSVLGVVGAVGAASLLPAADATRWAFTFFAFSLIYACSSRYLARLFLLNRRSRNKREQVIIYGAGSAAAQLIPSLLGNDTFLPVALVDDDVSLQGSRVKGIEVYSPDNLPKLIQRLKVTRVLLAMPSASRRKRRQVLEYLSEFPVHVQTVPEIGDIVTGKAQVDDIKDVDVRDLLGRDPVPPNEALLRASITHKSVMVTGAGGSIGSELCRQILQLRPRRLVLVEISEPALYDIERSLRKLRKKLDYECEFIPLLGSVHHEHRLREVIRTFEVNTVYHTAAYKHVPIVEQNVFEGIHNNVLGTLHIARAAIEGGAESFVLISTDKAVNPTNVMGATKRFAELVLQALNNEGSGTRFCMVRFGNVLESSGSVVPLFREQIRAGGPVTVTHRDIIRYFMTIPEAAQLVIQAGSMARGGDVFVLDMGKPVKILDLAHRMIRLMGMSVRSSEDPDGDIEIQFVGLRPAEKLYEELLIGSNVTGTEHPRIMRADEDFLPMEALSEHLENLNRASRDLDFDNAREILLSAVKEYSPQNEIDDLVFTRKVVAGDDTSSDRVIDFPGRSPVT